MKDKETTTEDSLEVATFQRKSKKRPLGKKISTSKKRMLNGSNVIQDEPPKNLEEPTLFQKVERFLRLKYELRFNEVTNEVESRELNKNSFKEINVNNLFIELEHNRLKISQENIIAILKSDLFPKYNPIRNYFESLPAWNPGGPDYIEMLANYVKTYDQSDFNYNFKKALVRTVACAINDDYHNKHAFILYGKKQHTGKTSFLRFLCPNDLKEYSTEHMSSNEADLKISFSKNFFFNIDELQGLSKYEINHLKSFFSIDYVNVRPPYGKGTIRVPRRVSFFGSTNEDEFLTDPTGSVRWIVFEMINIDFNYSIKIDINNVWAQAYYLLKSNFKYELTAEDRENNDKRNKVHQKRTIELELVQELFYPGTENDFDYKLSASEIGVELKYQYSNITLSVNLPQSIGYALSILGFEAKSTRIKNYENPVKKYLVKWKSTKFPMSLCKEKKNPPTTLLQNDEKPDELPF
jgi:predicted P-loop ATPase